MDTSSAQISPETVRDSDDRGALSPSPRAYGDICHDWGIEELRGLYALPFNDLIFQAHGVHRQQFDANKVQLSTLMNIKSGGCPEDCKYCAQSSRYQTGLQAEKKVPLADVVAAAQQAKAAGADRFCMGAAWRELKQRDVAHLCDMIREVKALGLETCVTLGMLGEAQASALKQAGLDYYNHNIDTSEEYYPEIVSTHSFQDRLDTLATVRAAGINVCSGGIIGLGESIDDRLNMLRSLANLPEHPGSVPLNLLVPIAGTPLAENPQVEPLDLVRLIATARIIMPKSVIRLSAGRSSLSDETQALAFFAGANSIFYGEQLLTTANAHIRKDQELMSKLGLTPLNKEGTCHARDS